MKSRQNETKLLVVSEGERVSEHERGEEETGRGAAIIRREIRENERMDELMDYKCLVLNVSGVFPLLLSAGETC